MENKNEYYLFYEMMMQSLKTDNVKEGMNNSLNMLRSYLNSGNIAIFRKNKDNKFVYKLSDSNMYELIMLLNCIVNKTSRLTKEKEIFNIELDLSERLKNLMLFHINVNNEEFIMAIINVDKKRELEPLFWNRLRDTITIIIKRASSYEKNIKALTRDLLTGLDNRNSYELRIQQFNEQDNDIVYGIFDLFRLKYINDNYTHSKGDEYIKSVAEILNKYWPKEKIIINDKGIEEKNLTGHNVYRIGGDEFVLITNKEELTLSTIKAELAREESSIIDLGIDNASPLGINFGLVKHNPNDSIKDTYKRADKIMQEDKTLMYKKYNLERRHQ